jgi:isopentenyldiphosphate isomerase
MKQKFIVTVSVIAYKEDGSLLVTERSSKEVQGSGMLAYCGGKIDDFEVDNTEDSIHSILQKTAIRELEQEAGVEIFEDSLQMVNNHAFKRYDGDLSLMIVFVAKFKSQKKIKLDEDEIQALHWMKFEDIESSRMYDSVYKVYTETNQYLKNRN